MNGIKSLIISCSDGGEINYLTAERYCDFLRINKEAKITSKFANVANSLYYVLYLIGHINKINRYDVVMVIGTSTALSVLFLSRLGIIKAKKIIWWGFYLHSQRSIDLYRKIRFLFETNRTVYVLFSEYEKKLYRKVLGKKTMVKVFQFGDWEKWEPKNQVEEDYYFSGGYSNRHYLPLIRAFEGTDHRLIIVASTLNKELIDIETTDNIKILFNLERKDFYDLMAKAKGVIIPLKYNSGASGQSVLIQAMIHQKLIIINDNEIMKEYVEDRYSGVMVKEIEKEIIQRIEEVEQNDELKREYITNSHQTYSENFSRGACIRKTLRILGEIQEDVR